MRFLLFCALFILGTILGIAIVPLLPDDTQKWIEDFQQGFAGEAPPTSPPPVITSPSPTPTATAVPTPTPPAVPPPVAQPTATPTPSPSPTPIVVATPTPTTTPRPLALYVVLASEPDEVDAQYIDDHALRFKWDATELAIGDVPLDTRFAAILQPSAFPKLTLIDVRRGFINIVSWQYSPAFITLGEEVYDAWVLRPDSPIGLFRDTTVKIGRNEPLPTPVPTPTPTMTPSPTATFTPAPTSTPTTTPTPSPTETPTPRATPRPTTTSIPTALSPHLRHLEHKEYMLALINAERAKAGLNPVVLGNNIAAQLHAEASLASCFSSHWGMDGLKPYMRYSLAGGYQSNGENWYGSDYSIKPHENYRPLESIKQEIEDAMKSWMDSPGHRRNILNPTHKKVNIGLAWDRFNIVANQHFEGDYVEYDSLPTIEGTVLSLSGRVKNGVRFSGVSDLSVQVFYDPPFHPLTRGQLHALTVTTMGALWPR